MKILLILPFLHRFRTTLLCTIAANVKNQLSHFKKGNNHCNEKNNTSIFFSFGVQQNKENVLSGITRCISAADVKKGFCEKSTQSHSNLWLIRGG